LRNRPDKSSGFTLLEIVVAFTLMALVISVLLGVFSGGLQGLGLADEYSRASSIAESTLGRVGADIALKEGETRGTEADRFRWAVQIKPFEVEQENQGQPQAIMAVQLMEVQVVVTWDDYGRNREVKLHTLRLTQKTI
jgi:general secretion pathway protein I